MRDEFRLEDLHIASPCGVSWDDMNRVGDGRRVRHCEHCTLNVYNIESMSREEATALIREHEGDRVCIRMLRRDDGTVVTADCPVGVARVKRRVRRVAAGLAALFGLGGVSLAVHSDASKTGLRPLVESQPFALISRKVFGRTPPAVAPPAPRGNMYLAGAVCITPSAPPSTINLTVEGEDLPVEVSH